MNEKIKKEWYNDGKKITWLILLTILSIIVCSQAFVSRSFSFTLLGSIINHNSIYFVLLVYFVLLQFSLGKKYFNYLNIFLGLVYLIKMATSFLTILQAFSPVAILVFILNVVLLVYFIHTMFRDSIIWRKYRFDQSPFNEIKNDSYYYAVVIISLLLLAVNLIGTVSISGVLLSILDTCYYVLFGRYIYLYCKYLDDKNINSNNSGNFDKVKEKVQDVLDKTDIDEKVVEIKEKYVDVSTEVKDNNSSAEKKKDYTNKKKEKKKNSKDTTFIKKEGSNKSNTSKKGVD